MATLLISDCHLTPDRPRPFREFLYLMAGPARAMDAVYILGDLFDLWLGDDDDAPGHDEVVAGLAGTTASGTPVFVMCGNHDFLLGNEFARRTGCTLLQDPTLTEIEGRAALLLHGDTLCVDDTEYQRYRAWVRSPDFVESFVAKPLDERRRIAADIQHQSRDATAGKPMDRMDAAPRAVADAFRRHGVDLMIHGHTHRPAVHTHQVDGRTVTRIVLDDWYHHGSALVWDRSGYRAVTVDALIAGTS